MSESHTETMLPIQQNNHDQVSNPVEGSEANVNAKRGRGRPKGSKNKKKNTSGGDGDDGKPEQPLKRPAGRPRGRGPKQLITRTAQANQAEASSEPDNILPVELTFNTQSFAALQALTAGPGPGTQSDLKRKLGTSSSPSPRPKQLLKSKDLSGLNSQATLNSPSPLDQLKYHFHDSFLYSDGSVIIRIGMTQFKLHRTLLAEHGAWFRERFEEDPDDRIRELPVYILDGVVEEPDFVNLLTAVKEAITYLESPPKSVLASILRAAHRLRFARFKNWVIGLLEKMWSAELEPLSQSSCTTRLSIRLSPDEATAIVSVARECGLESVLKRALYELVRTDCFGQKSTSLASTSTSSGSSSVTLSSSDYHLLVQARERLVSSWISVAAASLNFPPCSDAAIGPCVARGPVPDTTIFRLLHESPSSHLLQGFNEMEVSRSLFETYTNDPLSGVEKLALLSWEGGPEEKGLGYCAPCAQARKEFWMKRREDWWEIFGQDVGC